MAHVVVLATQSLANRQRRCCHPRVQSQNVNERVCYLTTVKERVVAQDPRETSTAHCRTSQSAQRVQDCACNRGQAAWPHDLRVVALRKTVPLAGQ